MSAERLREAAKVLRERGRLADGELPWRVEGDQVVDSSDPVTSPSDWIADACNERTADYIATMRPGVGLALADWLDIEAGRNPERPISDGITVGGPLLQAIAVADAILGGQS